MLRQIWEIMTLRQRYSLYHSSPARRGLIFSPRARRYFADITFRYYLANDRDAYITRRDFSL